MGEPHARRFAIPFTVWIHADPAVGGRVARFPIRLAPGLEDPDGFIAALGAAQTV